MWLFLACQNPSPGTRPTEPVLPEPEDSGGSHSEAPTELTLEVVGLPDLAGGVSIEVTGPPGPVEVACEGAGERWHRTLPGPGAFAWYALVADADWSCVATNGTDEARAELRTPPWPADVPTFEVTGTPEPHYTLVGIKREFGEVLSQLLLVDPLGRVRWRSLAPAGFNVGCEAAYLPETARGPRFLMAGGEGLPPTLIGWDGSIDWQAGPPTGGTLWHHDVSMLPGGDLVGLTELPWDGGVEGFGIEQVVPWTDERTYVWSVQTAVDRGQVDQKPGPDPFHANALEWHPEDPEGPSYWISSKSAHQIFRLDPATGDVTYRIGVGGDFQLLETDGTPAPDSRWFYGQHAPEAHLETDGTWTVTVYDNGGGRPVSGPRFSRVLALQVDVEARTARLLWEWLGDGWYEPVFGDVDVLADGRVLVTRGHCPQCGGVAEVPGAVLVLDPTTLTESWSLSTGDPDHSLYRAAPLDPCGVVPDNQTSCP